jgi:NAD(P)-dependent dehydrogenase (short-subunit alcohol dehydrogenase family)
VKEWTVGALDGQVALVTGAGRGIGRAVARALADAGAAVALVARSEDQLAAAAAAIGAGGGRPLPVAADVRDAAAVRRAVAEAERRLGPITFLLNNAGTPGPFGPDWEVDADAWWECVEVGVRGAFLCNQAVVPGMIARGGGRIVHTVSTTGTTARPTMTATSVAKTALIRLTEGLAQAAGPHGVRVFALHPGLVDTDLLRAYGLDLSRAAFDPPERVAAVCVRLAAGDGDALSGRFLRVDDDLDALVRRAAQIAEQQLLTLRING